MLETPVRGPLFAHDPVADTLADVPWPRIDAISRHPTEARYPSPASRANRRSHAHPAAKEAGATRLGPPASSGAKTASSAIPRRLSGFVRAAARRDRRRRLRISTRERPTSRPHGAQRRAIGLAVPERDRKCIDGHPHPRQAGLALRRRLYAAPGPRPVKFRVGVPAARQLLSNRGSSPAQGPGRRCPQHRDPLRDTGGGLSRDALGPLLSSKIPAWPRPMPVFSGDPRWTRAS